MGKHIFTVIPLLCIYLISNAGDPPKRPDIMMKSDHGTTVNDSIQISWGNVITTLCSDTIISDSAIITHNPLQVKLKGNIYISQGKRWKVAGNELVIDYLE